MSGFIVPYLCTLPVVATVVHPSIHAICLRLGSEFAGSLTYNLQLSFVHSQMQMSLNDAICVSGGGGDPSDMLPRKKVSPPTPESVVNGYELGCICAKARAFPPKVSWEFIPACPQAYLLKHTSQKEKGNEEERGNKEASDPVLELTQLFL